MNYSDIKFDNNLIKDKYCEITYSGYLFQNNSDSVTIVYGFDDDWKYTDAKEMFKTENGFIVNLKMQNCDTFKFCFRNNNYEWDNNYGQNFEEPISDNTNSTSEDLSLTDASLVDDNLIDHVLDSIYETEIEEISSTDFTTNLFKSLSTIEEFEASKELNDPISLDETLVNASENYELNQYLLEETSEKQNLLNSILSSNLDFSMDSLVDEILSPINSANVFNEEAEKEIFNEYTEDVSTEDMNLDDKIDNLITNIYENIDSIKNENTSNYTETTSTEYIEPVMFADTLSDLEEDAHTDDEIDTLIKKIYRKVDVTDSETTVETDEPSILENVNESQSTSLVVSPRALSKTYLFKKKIKLAFMKLLKLLPKGTTASDYDK